MRSYHIIYNVMNGRVHVPELLSAISNHKPRRRWEDIRMDLQEVICGGMDWIEQAQDRNRWWAIVIVIMNFWVPENEGDFLTS